MLRMTHLMLGKKHNALDDEKEAIKLNPSSCKSISALALIESELGMSAQAKEHAAQAIKPQPMAPILYVNDAAICLRNGETKEALKDCNTALAVDPYLKEGYELRAKIFETMGATTKSSADKQSGDKVITHLSG